MATIATYGDVEHTFIERTNYTGLFLPGYATPIDDVLLKSLYLASNLDPRLIYSMLIMSLAISLIWKWFPLANSLVCLT